VSDPPSPAVRRAGPAASLGPLLQSIVPDLQAQVRSQLGGFFGGIVQAYLPQHWVFRTESDVATLSVARDGVVTVEEGVPANPDVTVEATLDSLVTALTQRSQARLPHGSVRASPHTPKGKAAFDYLRGRFGL